MYQIHTSYFVNAQNYDFSDRNRVGPSTISSYETPTQSHITICLTRCKISMAPGGMRALIGTSMAVLGRFIGINNKTQRSPYIASICRLLHPFLCSGIKLCTSCGLPWGSYKSSDFDPNLYFVCEGCNVAISILAPDYCNGIVVLGLDTPQLYATTILRFTKCRGPSLHCKCSLCLAQRTHATYWATMGGPKFPMLGWRRAARVPSNVLAPAGFAPLIQKAINDLAIPLPEVTGARPSKAPWNHDPVRACPKCGSHWTLPCSETHGSHSESVCWPCSHVFYNTPNATGMFTAQPLTDGQWAPTGQHYARITEWATARRAGSSRVPLHCPTGVCRLCPNFVGPFHLDNFHKPYVGALLRVCDPCLGHRLSDFEMGKVDRLLCTGAREWKLPWHNDRRCFACDARIAVLAIRIGTEMTPCSSCGIIAYGEVVYDMTDHCYTKTSGPDRASIYGDA